jgi:hypothetical protein
MTRACCMYRYCCAEPGMADPDARARARQHTAHLLKVLRGYGPSAAAPEPTVSPSATVAEAAPSYAAGPGATPLRPIASLALPPLLAPAGPRSTPTSIPTLGEGLRRRTGVLGQLVAKADQFNRLNRIFRAYLPPHLHPHTVLIRLDREAWEAHADSASWATRLRYALHNIRQTLGQELGMPLPKPRVRVMPVAAPPSLARPRPTLSERSAKVLETAARQLPDPRLSAALLRLAGGCLQPSE